MSRPQRCSEPISLSEREIRLLSEIPHGSTSIETELRCELEGGHRGPHAALGDFSKPVGAGRLASGEAVCWWVRWEDPTGRRDVVPQATCPVETRPGEVSSEVCTLFAKHPGRHDFDWAVPDYSRMDES